MPTAAADAPSPAAPPRKGRGRRTADAAPAPSATGAEALAITEAIPQAEPPAARPRRGRARGAARAETAAPTGADVAVDRRAIAAPPDAPETAFVQPLDPGTSWGGHAVALPGDDPAEVTLRDAASAWCTCLDFALSEDGRCVHVDAVHAWLRSDPSRAAALEAGPQRVSSRVVLAQGARRRPQWLPGLECPPPLAERATAQLAADAADDATLPRLLRAAREAGHGVQVDEAVWAHLAAARDARWRVHRLESLLPDGPSSAALQGLTPAPLLPLQAEGALFALCAGRSVLADCVELQPAWQALAAVRLARRHFGVQRVLVLAPSDVLETWRRWLGDDTDVALMSLERVADDAALHRQLAPELVVVHEPADGGLWVDADRAAALLRLPPALAIVLPGPDALAHPAEWPLRIAFVDADRQGAYAALLAVHGERDEAGQLCGLAHLDRLRDTLAPVLLARPLDEVRAQLPERVDRVQPVPLPAAARDTEGALRAAVVDGWRRWQAAGWLSDAAQRRLWVQLQDLRRCCAGDGSHEVASAKAEAVRGLMDGGAVSLPKAVAFAQWPAALRAIGAQLVALQPALLDPAEPSERREQALQRFRDDPACRLLLVVDAGGAPLDLGLPDLPVLHLDRPWHPRTLARRFGRVHRRGQAHLVPVHHLVLAGTLEQRLVDTTDARGDTVSELMDAQPSDGFLQGDALAAHAADLARLFELDAAPAAAA